MKNVQLGQLLFPSKCGLGEAAGVEAREPSAEMYQILFHKLNKQCSINHEGLVKTKLQSTLPEALMRMWHPTQ